MEESFEGQLVISGSRMAVRLAPEDLGARREMVYTEEPEEEEEEGEEEERRVERMKEPTRPVEPITRVDD